MRRKINLKESEQLNNRISEIKNSLGIKLNWFLIIVLIGITIASAFHIYFFDKSNWSLISKFLVCAAPIGLWVLVEQYFKRKKSGNKEY
ncbi:hypothetical protein [Marinifilum caeruleilacunae]|uniref:hypothetical protein n=1 Tax=Marinifilum caeruleilacunae TaxID=2499076 RepID=UPI001492DAAE|nr:hypothetical protein [Marinifilum caeruleilacunae]